MNQVSPHSSSLPNQKCRFFQTGSHCVAQADLKLREIFWLLPFPQVNSLNHHSQSDFLLYVQIFNALMPLQVKLGMESLFVAPIVQILHPSGHILCFATHLLSCDDFYSFQSMKGFSSCFVSHLQIYLYVFWFSQAQTGGKNCFI